MAFPQYLSPAFIANLVRIGLGQEQVIVSAKEALDILTAQYTDYRPGLLKWMDNLKLAVFVRDGMTRMGLYITDLEALLIVDAVQNTFPRLY